MTKEVKQDGNIWYKCICDNCGNVAENEEEGFDLMPDELSSEQMASDLEWQVNGLDIHYCPNCIIDEEE